MNQGAHAAAACPAACVRMHSCVPACRLTSCMHARTAPHAAEQTSHGQGVHACMHAQLPMHSSAGAPPAARLLRSLPRHARQQLHARLPCLCWLGACGVAAGVEPGPEAPAARASLGRARAGAACSSRSIDRARGRHRLPAGVASCNPLPPPLPCAGALLHSSLYAARQQQQWRGAQKQQEPPWPAQRAAGADLAAVSSLHLIVFSQHFPACPRGRPAGSRLHGSQLPRDSHGLATR